MIGDPRRVSIKSAENIFPSGAMRKINSIRPAQLSSVISPFPFGIFDA
jgi:hypothetical protein